MKRIFIGLGSNQGDRLAHLRVATRYLAQQVSLAACSHVYASQALLLPGSPKEWDIPFYNCVVMGKTALSPQALLHFLKEGEREGGRVDRGRWGPREIDLDLLDYEGHICESEELTLPHSRLHERLFVLLPWQEIAPQWHYPPTGEQAGKTIDELLGQAQAAAGEMPLRVLPPVWEPQRNKP